MGFDQSDRAQGPIYILNPIATSHWPIHIIYPPRVQYSCGYVYTDLSLLFLLQTHILDRMAWLVFLRSSVTHRLKTAEKFRKQGINIEV